MLLDTKYWNYGKILLGGTQSLVITSDHLKFAEIQINIMMSHLLCKSFNVYQPKFLLSAAMYMNHWIILDYRLVPVKIIETQFIEFSYYFVPPPKSLAMHSSHYWEK